MRLAVLLLVSALIITAVGALVLVLPSVRRQFLSLKYVLAAVLLSALLSVGSAVVSRSSGSGTGTRTSHGFPKPYYFRWESWEQPISDAGVNWLYFAGNCIAWLSVVSLTMVIWLAARRRFKQASMR